MKRCRYFLAVVPMLVSMVWAQPQFTQNASLTPLGELNLNVSQLVSVIVAVFTLLMVLGFALFEAGGNRRHNVATAFSKILLGSFFAVPLFLLANALYVTKGTVDISALFMMPLAMEQQVDSVPFLFFLHILDISVVVAILSVATSGRIKLFSFLLITIFVAALLYPFGFAWLIERLNGLNSTVESSAFMISMQHWIDIPAAFAALGVLFALGARQGRYGAKRELLEPSNLTALLMGGCLIYIGLFVRSLLGYWASNLFVEGTSASAFLIASTSYNLIMATTLSLLTASLTMLLLYRRLDASLLLNAAIAALVMMQSATMNTTPAFMIVMALITGVVVIVLIKILDIFCIDDPVGVITVHGFIAVLASLTLTLTLEMHDSFVVTFSKQLLGVALVASISCISTFIVSMIVKGLIGLRPTPEKEMQGMDVVTFGYIGYRGEQA